MRSEELERETLRRIAGLMCVAARTAPKAKGTDNIVTIFLENGPDKDRLIRRMRELAVEQNKPGFSRDALNVEAADCLVIIGTTSGPLGISYCGCCGFADCAAMAAASGQCAFNPLDLGIAIGSAVSVAGRHHADNRIMYSAGKTAVELRLFGEDPVRLAMAIPLSASGKNIFFDR